MKLKNMWKRFWTLDVHNHEGFTLVELVIEVATTLERQTYPMLSGYRKMLAAKPESGTGLTGTVKLITK